MTRRLFSRRKTNEPISKGATERTEIGSNRIAVSYLKNQTTEKHENNTTNLPHAGLWADDISLGTKHCAVQRRFLRQVRPGVQRQNRPDVRRICGVVSRTGETETGHA